MCIICIVEILKDKLEEALKCSERITDMDVIRYVKLNEGNASLSLKRL